MRGIISVAMVVLPAVAWSSGVIQYTEGRVLLDQGEIAPKHGEFLNVDPGHTLATLEGRAEVLFSSGTFVRLSEDSSIGVVSSDLSDTRIEILSGSAIVELDALPKNSTITLQSGGATISLQQRGLYRVDAGLLRVYSGEAAVTSGGQTVTVKKGRKVDLGQLALAKFDTGATDVFDRWSKRRAGYIATANITSASSVLSGGWGYGCGSAGFSNWVYNSWFGMYTFVPCDDFGYSPYGYAIYGRQSVSYVVPQYARGRIGVATALATPLRTVSPPTTRAYAVTRGTTTGVAEGPIPESSSSNIGTASAPPSAPAPSADVRAPTPATSTPEVSGARAR